MADQVQESPVEAPDVNAGPDTPPARVWTGTNYPTAADFPDGNCRIGPGSSLVADAADPRWNWVATNCQLDKGVKLLLPDDPEEQPVVKKTPKHEPVAAPEAVAVEEKKELSVESHEEAVAPAPALAPVAAAPVAPQTVATVGVDQAIGQVKSLLPADASPALMLGGAVAFAAVGAALKFGPSMLKARHEAKMKQLEIEEKKAEQQDDKHEQCSASRMVLEAKVAEQAAQLTALTSKLSEVEAKASKAPEPAEMPFGDFDPEEMEKRLKKLEKVLKPEKAPKPEKKPVGRPRKNSAP